MRFRLVSVVTALPVAFMLALTGCSSLHSLPPPAVNVLSLSGPDARGVKQTYPKVSLLFSFTNSLMGVTPNSPLVQDAHGDFYGTTVYGGVNNGGLLFELSPRNGQYIETALLDFSGQNVGTNPGAISFDANGNIWGITGYGFNFNGDGLFELSPSAGIRWNGRLIDPNCFLPYSAGSVAPYKTWIFAACGGRVDQVSVASDKLTMYQLNYDQYTYSNGGVTTAKDGRLWGSTFWFPDCCVYAGPTYQGTPEGARYAFQTIFTEPTFAPPGLAPDGALFEVGFVTGTYGQVFKAVPSARGFKQPVAIYNRVQSGSTTAPAIGADGAVYFADGNEVKKLTPSGNSYRPSILYTLPYQGYVEGVWLDSAGDVFGVGDPANGVCQAVCGSIFKISP